METTIDKYDLEKMIHTEPSVKKQDQGPFSNRISELYHGIRDGIKNAVKSSSTKAKIAVATLAMYGLMNLAAPAIKAADYERGSPKPPKPICVVDAGIGLGISALANELIYHLLIKPHIKHKDGETAEHYKKRLSNAHWISFGSFAAAGIAGGTLYYFTLDNPNYKKKLAEWTKAQNINPDDANPTPPEPFVYMAPQSMHLPTAAPTNHQTVPDNVKRAINEYIATHDMKQLEWETQHMDSLPKIYLDLSKKMMIFEIVRRF